MANMGYCRFQNTLRDLSDCVDNWSEELSEAEKQAREGIVRLAYEILTEEGYSIEQAYGEN